MLKGVPKWNEAKRRTNSAVDLAEPKQRGGFRVGPQFIRNPIMERWSSGLRLRS